VEKKSASTFWRLFFLSLILLSLDRLGRLEFVHRRFLSLTRRWRQGGVEQRQQPELDCQTKVAQLEAELARLEEENRAARRLLGADLSPKLKFVPAHLLGLNEREFSLDVGQNQGVQKDAWVMSENILVGRITQVNCCVSQGMFVSHPGFRLAVSIWRSSQERRDLIGKGLLRGGSRSLTVEQILPEEEVAPGDLVASLESGGQFVVGKVVEVGLGTDKVFQKAVVEWLLQPRQLETVFVVKQ